MTNSAKRAGALLVSAAMLLSMIACKKTPDFDTEQPSQDSGSSQSGTTTTVSVPALVDALVRKVAFASPLADVGESAILYFSNLPDGTQVQLYAGSGYFADEVVLLTVAKSADMAAAKASVEAHIAQIRTQFANYIPAELGKIDKALVWESGNYIVVCITDDYENAKKLLDSGDPNYQLGSGTEPTQGSAPTTAPTAPEFTAPTISLPTTEPSTGSEPTTPSSEPTTPTDEPTATTEPSHTDPTVPGVDENGYPILTSQSGTYSMYYNGVIRVDNAAYEVYGYDASVAADYAALVNKLANSLAGTAKVYCLPIPTGFDIMLPNDIRAQSKTYTDPVESTEKLAALLNGNVTTIRCADNLLLHRNEYLYFRTDHHWNGLGAYYAYEAFCETKGITPYTLQQRQGYAFSGFLGSYYTATKDSNLLPADTVYAFKPYSTSASMVYYDSNNNAISWPIINDVTNYASYAKYFTFAAADQTLAKFTNPQVTDGSVAIVVKESFGNAIMPYLVDHYSTIYEIDYRYWSGDLAAFAREVGADEVIFANNLGAISTSISVARIANIIK